MRLKKLFTAASLLTVCSVGSLFAGGCAENRTTLFVNGVYFLAGEDNCEYDASLAAPLLLRGSYNPSTGFPYIAPLILANGMQRLGDNDTLRPETSRIQVQGAEIAISTAAGAVAAPEFSVNFSGTIHPDESEDPGVAVMEVAIIPAGLGLPAGEYQVGITVFGETLGGTKVESGQFNFTVEVTDGLITCDSAAALPEGSIHPCGPRAQDGFFFPCGDFPGADFCAVCSP